MSDEHLWRELQEKEQEEDYRYKQNLAPKILFKVTPKEVDHNAAMRRYEQEIAPVLARRQKARTSKAYRLYLKATGQWTDLDAAEVVDKSKHFTQVGPTVEDIVKEVQANPAAYKHLAKTGEKVTPVIATHRKIEPKLADEPRDET